MENIINIQLIARTKKTFDNYMVQTLINQKAIEALGN